MKPGKAARSRALEITPIDKRYLEMFTCKVRLGYDPELAFPATLTVTETELVIREVGRDPVILTPEEVVSFEVKGWIPFFTQAIVIHHVRFNKRGKLVVMPPLTTCRKVIAGIRAAGFIPKAKPPLA